MVDMLAAAQGGMLDDVQRMQVISHNIANSTTPGFKREIVTSRAFAGYIDQAMRPGQINTYPGAQPQGQVVIDHSQGTLRYTGNPLDVAIQGDGYFEVMTAQGPAYTRQGNFRIDSTGRLLTVTGLPVLGNGGEIVLSGDKPVIDHSGKITEGQREVAQLRTVLIADPSTLTEAGSGLYLPSASTQTSDGTAGIRQGYLEAANVTVMDEMVHLIETMRHFESSQRLMTGYDEMLDKAINVVGEV